MFGRTTRRRGAPPLPRHRQAGRAVRAGRRSASIDPAAKRVETDAGHVRRRRPRRRARRRPRPGGDARAASRAATSSTRCAGAFALRDVLAELRRRPGDRRRHVDAVQVPAGAERDRAADARLPHRARAARPLARSRWSCRCRCRSRRRPTRRRRCSPRSPSAASTGTRSGWSRGLDPDRKVAHARATAARCPTTCSSACPCTARPPVVAESGLTVDGWIPVDPLTLETAFPDVYAVGDVTSVGTPKAGVFAEGQAAVVADAIIARASAGEPTSAQYDGRGICYLEFGHDQVAKVDVTFEPDTLPSASSRGRRSRSPPTRPSSARAASGAGSAVRGSERASSRRRSKFGVRSCSSSFPGRDERISA